MLILPNLVVNRNGKNPAIKTERLVGQKKWGLLQNGIPLQRDRHINYSLARVSQVSGPRYHRYWVTGITGIGYHAAGIITAIRYQVLSHRRISRSNGIPLSRFSEKNQLKRNGRTKKFTEALWIFILGRYIFRTWNPVSKFYRKNNWLFVETAKNRKHLSIVWEECYTGFMEMWMREKDEMICRSIYFMDYT